MSKGNKSKIDNLGRVVIPKSIRKSLGIEHNDAITMYVENNKLIISKDNKLCVMCHTNQVSVQIGEIYFCQTCIENIKNL